jgi:NADPH2:quinone reductase
LTKVVRIYENGGPEVLRIEDVDLGQPGPGEVLIRQSAIGLNFREIYIRNGVHKSDRFPRGMGLEGAGVIEALGEGVDAFSLGQRVVVSSMPDAAYAEARMAPAHRVLALPDNIDERTAAAVMTKGMTARNLLIDTYPVQPGETILIHAAAGGVGLIMCQWAKLLGATVIGTMSSDEKAEIARAHGCDHTIIYTRENFTDRVREITDGAGVPVVYDSVGELTFHASLDCLQPRGMMVQFGEASGDPLPIPPRILGLKGSLYLTHPSLGDYAKNRDDLLRQSGDLFDMVGSGKIKIGINQTYPLSEVAQAHRDMEARITTGSSLLIP